MHAQTPDSAIIERVLSGDPRSFEAIVKKYQERVLRLCISMVGESQAEDAAQEIFIKVYESLDRFRKESSFSTWIYRIASNHCLNLLSKKKREKAVPLEEIIETLPSGSSPSNLAENKQLVDAVFQQMTPEEKTILTLREMEGLNYKEIAEALDISIDLVKVRLFRARNAFLKIARKFL